MRDKILIMTDTVACIPGNLAQKYNIAIVPAANIIFDGHQYIDGVTLSATEAYELIRKDPDKFMTSALSPAYLLEQYRKLGEGYDHILFIILSSNLSAGFTTASLAADLYRSESPRPTIEVLDSKSCASSQGLTVLAAAKAVEKGMDFTQLIRYTTKVRNCTRGLMMLDTLRYVYRTGRISKLGAKIASMFNIKPINRVTEEGKIEMVDRTRNREHGLEILVDLVHEQSQTDELHFMVTHAADPEGADTLVTMLQDRFTCLDMVVNDFSPVMGYGAGPGTLFVGFHPDVKF
jgi:DegV family protein with EDD domain